MKIAIVAALLTLAPVTVLAQAVSPATSGTMTSADVGVSPISGLSIGVQKGPPIGVQKGPPSSSSVTGMTGALFALVAA